MKERVVNLVNSYIELPKVGIDISDRSMKYLKFVDGRRRSAIDCYGEVAIPEGWIVNGEIQKEDELATFLREWLSRERKRIRTNFAVLALPEEKSFLRQIQLPRMESEKIGNAIRWEIEANIPLPPSDLVYDFEVIEPFEENREHLDVVITAFPREIVEAYVHVLKRAGIQPAALELESQAIVRATVPVLHEKRARIIVDMGRTRTSFVIFVSGAIFFTRTIELGGALLEENIAKALSVGPDEAAKLKKEVGLDKSARNGDVFNALVPPVSALAEELRNAVAYYKEHSVHAHGAHNAIDEVLLSGGDANLAGLATYISSSLKLPVRRADPWAGVWKRFDGAIPPIPLNQSLAYTVAIGLALRGRVSAFRQGQTSA